MKKLMMVICTLFLLSGCSQSDTKSDMSHYEGFTDTDHVFVDIDVKGMAKKIDDGDTFVIYFGFSECPWCKEAMPILNEIAKEYEMQVYYVNTRKEETWSSNLDIDDYDLFVQYMDAYLDYDDNGIKHLYTPHVFFIKDGKVVLEHQSTVDGHDAHERTMTDEEVKALKQIYSKGFELLK